MRSHLFVFFLFWRGGAVVVVVVAAGMVRRARSGAIHHAPLPGFFKDKEPSAAAIHQL